MKNKIKNIAIITFFNSKVGNLIIDKFFKKNIKIKDVILIGKKENKAVSQNYFNYLNTYQGVDILDLEKYHINFHFIKKINSKNTVNLLKKLKINILLSNSGIIKNQIINIPGLKILNSHPGVLPKYRGAMCPEWSVINKDKNVGATCHLLNENIDEGPILYTEKLKFPYPKNYNTFRQKVYDLQAAVMIKGVKMLSKHKFNIILQKKNQGKFYKPMNRKLISKVKFILKKNSF